MENKIETPLIRLIAQLKDRIEFCKDGGCDTNQTEIDTLEIVIMTANDLLPYEREVIENAFDSGLTFTQDGKEFYTQTFQTNE
jgi:hypothetical protein